MPQKEDKMSRRVKTINCTSCHNENPTEKMWFAMPGKGVFPLCQKCSRAYTRFERATYAAYKSALQGYFTKC